MQESLRNSCKTLYFILYYKSIICYYQGCVCSCILILLSYPRRVLEYWRQQGCWLQPPSFATYIVICIHIPRITMPSQASFQYNMYICICIRICILVLVLVLVRKIVLERYPRTTKRRKNDFPFLWVHNRGRAW
jgi:hypothetical protein